MFAPISIPFHVDNTGDTTPNHAHHSVTIAMDWRHSKTLKVEGLLILFNYCIIKRCSASNYKRPSRRAFDSQHCTFLTTVAPHSLSTSNHLSTSAEQRITTKRNSAALSTSARLGTKRLEVLGRSNRSGYEKISVTYHLGGNVELDMTYHSHSSGSQHQGHRAGSTLQC